jgi:hypothetical protein
MIDHARLIVQDDSGIPYHQLKKQGFQVHFYGEYTKPYGTSFNHYLQKDLREIYLDKRNINPIDFRMGYGFGRVQTCLMKAIQPLPYDQKNHQNIQESPKN